MILFDHSVPALQEIERLRELNLQAEQEKVNAVAHVRSEAKEEIVKMRDKIQEVKEKLVYNTTVASPLTSCYQLTVVELGEG